MTQNVHAAEESARVPAEGKRKSLLVAGSLNMDIVVRVDRHPKAGETVHGAGPDYFPGGKGANQAVAAGRAGANVRMLGAVGADAFGTELLNSLQSAGVRTDSVRRTDGASGMAFITVENEGENRIVVCGNANLVWTPADLDASAGFLAEASGLLLQNEIPPEANARLLELAAGAGVPVFYNPAPVAPIPDDAYARIAFLIVNEKEAESLSGVAVTDEASAAEAGRRLCARGARHAIVTLGPRGALAVRQGAEPIHVPAVPVEVVDTTAAGDTFIGAFAASWAEGAGIAQAMRFASAASGLAVSRAGAQASIPMRHEVEKLLALHFGADRPPV